MNVVRFPAVLVLFALLHPGCGGGGSTPTTKECTKNSQCDTGYCAAGKCVAKPDALQDIADLGEVDAPPLPDEMADGSTDGDVEPPPDGGDPGPDAPVEGGFKWPCKTADDCLSGFCMTTIWGSLCTINCVEKCPDPAWTCEYLTPAGLDPLWACVPPKTSQCRPCTKDSDCTGAPGEDTARCIEYGPSGRFCGVDCSADAGLCKAGSSCKDVNTLDWQAAKVCVADSGDCPCLQGFLGLATPCFQEASGLKCTGTRTCGKDGWETCTAALPAPEVCDNLDNDCNGITDDMGVTACGTGVCQHEVVNCDKGKPGLCDPFAGSGPEACNGKDDDCDGQTDELWPEKGSPCDGPDSDACKNGTFGCSETGEGLVCEKDDVNFVEECNGKDDDCDGEADEVADLGETKCGKGVCDHTVPNCANGQLQTCDPMQGAQANDSPDLDFTDSNCDGIDGDIAVSVFVDTVLGADANEGTIDAPMRTIAAGLEKAAAQGKTAVLVSQGVYGETLTLKDGIGVYGLYDRATKWSRKVDNATTVKGDQKAVIAVGLNNPTEVQGLIVVSGSATSPGASSYGVFAKDSPGLALVGDSIQAGSGANGAQGSYGTPGLNGSSGSDGNQGCEYGCNGCLFDCFGSCGSCSQPQGGKGGGSPCGSNGGNGGNGGKSNESGFSGIPGQGTGAGSGGNAGGKTGNGSVGGQGQGGTTGGPGGGGLEFGNAGPDGYLPADGVKGIDGTPGGGGGGGGSGGG